MINPFFSRLHRLATPVAELTVEQGKALCRFREKLAQGVYSLEEARCLCGGRQGTLIAQRDRYALPVNSFLCKSCGVMWQNPRMTADSLARFYQEDYRSLYVGDAQTADGLFLTEVRQGRAIYEFIASSAERPQGTTVFDVGCGAGGVLVPFKEAGCNVFGEFLLRGRKAGLVLEHGDMSVLAQHAPADLVILSHVLEHLPSPHRCLEQISQMLADGGYLYVEVPGILHIHSEYGDPLLFLQNAHLYHFTLATLVSLLAQVGFGLVKGDEEIRALFTKERSRRSISTADQYYKILAYLSFTELARFFHLSHVMRVTRRLRRRSRRWLERKV